MSDGNTLFRVELSFKKIFVRMSKINMVIDENGQTDVGQNYRFATLLIFYLTVQGTITMSLKSMTFLTYLN